jgi:DNA polymerase-3 subunit delta'
MKFINVIGHTEIKKKLISSVNDGRIPHAQLILGSEGGGGLALTRAYVQYIVCENKQASDSCGECSPCKKVATLSHPDVHFAFPVISPGDSNNSLKSEDKMDDFRSAMTAEPYMNFDEWLEFGFKEIKNANINTKQCEEIITRLSLKPYEAKYKFMIIWLPERIYHSAAPKLLKIIEEPPPQTVFLLVSANDEQILNTIKSRTQLIKLKKLDDFDMMEGLMNLYHIPLERAREIVNVSDGNFNQALRLAETDVEENVEFDFFVKWMRACFTYDIVVVSQLGEKLSNMSRDKQRGVFLVSLHLLRGALTNNIESALLRATENERNFLNKFSPFVHEKNISAITSAIEKSMYYIERNVNSKVMFTDLSLTIADALKIKNT